MNFLYDDIVHVYTTKYNCTIDSHIDKDIAVYIYGILEAVHHYKTASNVKRNLHDKLKIESK